MKDECLICGAPLKYLNTSEIAKCYFCGAKERTKTLCENNHYVCDDCHLQGLDHVIDICLKEDSKNPIEIFEKITSKPFCHMHGPEHHVIVGASLITGYKNSGGNICLESALREMLSRGKNVPGGACGFWGACGAGLSSGMFISIISSSTPLSDEPFALSHKMTSKSLNAIGDVGGLRCCKRDSYLSIYQAIDFVKEYFGIEMEKTPITCRHSSKNNQYIGNKCPFSAVNAK